MTFAPSVNIRGTSQIAHTLDYHCPRPTPTLISTRTTGEGLNVNRIPICFQANHWAHCNTVDHILRALATFLDEGKIFLGFRISAKPRLCLEADPQLAHPMFLRLCLIVMRIDVISPCPDRPLI